MSQRQQEAHKCLIPFSIPPILIRLGQLLPNSAGVENEAHIVDATFPAQPVKWQSRCHAGLSSELLPFPSPSIPLTFPLQFHFSNHWGESRGCFLIHCHGIKGTFQLNVLGFLSDADQGSLWCFTSLSLGSSVPGQVSVFPTKNLH